MNKTVLITGGGKRLGAAMCLAFSRANWQIACHYSHSEQDALILQAKIRAQGRVCELFAADLESPQQTQQLFEAVVSHFERIDCVINNASMFVPDEGLTSTYELFSKHQNINLFAPLQLTQLLAKHGKMNNYRACAVQILDQKVDNLNPDYFSYTLSKLSLRNAIKLQAQALAPYVRVMGVSPGLIYVSGPQSQVNFEKASKVNLLKIPTDPNMVAKAVLDLAENPAINGAIVNVDSGQHLVPLGRDIMFIVDEL